jgi:hypothetical protein
MWSEPPRLSRSLGIVLTVLAVEVLTVLSNVALNVATGGVLPRPLRSYEWLAWPLLGLTTLAGALIAAWERFRERERGRERQRAALGQGPPPPAELPPDIREFTDRRRELARLTALVSADRGTSAAPVIVTIAGMPGSGKSTLAVHFAHMARRRFSYGDAQLYLDLQGASSEPLAPAEALRRLLHALGVDVPGPAADTQQLASLYRTNLDGKRAILLLDNAASEEQVRWLLPGSSACLVLVTSQAPLAGLAGTVPLQLDVMEPGDAMALLAAIASESPSSPEAAERVARQCGYLPLALSIAGVRMRTRPGRPVEDLAARLEDEQGRLRELAVGDRAVRASFDVSYEQLSELERRLFRRLRILPVQRFTAGQAAALIESEPAEAEALLEHLVDAQLMELFAERRYGFHDLIGLYAQERLRAEETPEDRDAALERALRVYDEESGGVPQQRTT